MKRGFSRARRVSLSISSCAPDLPFKDRALVRATTQKVWTILQSMNTQMAAAIGPFMNSTHLPNP